MNHLAHLIVFMLGSVTPARANFQAGAAAFISPRCCLVALLLLALAVLASCAPADPPDGGMRSYDDGLRAYDSGDFARALEIWEPLAKNGDGISQYSLGKLFENGAAGVPRNAAAAAEWYQLSASQGVAAAQNNLGMMYAKGRGVPQDMVRAAELWCASAETDHVIAEFNLGLAYHRGEGVRQDRPQARYWFRRASEHGFADAQYALAQLLRTYQGGDKAEALYWYQRAADQGHAKAETQAQRLSDAGVKAHEPLASSTQPTALMNCR
jgi:TPR repeat protein